MPRAKSLFRIRKPQLRITSRGVRVSPPSVRVGDSDSYVNVSSSGVSYTKRTRFGTFNSRRGCTVPIGVFVAVFCVSAAAVFLR